VLDNHISELVGLLPGSDGWENLVSGDSLVDEQYLLTLKKCKK
jgi:hypothetical protein